jgi:hypothetical protein
VPQRHFLNLRSGAALGLLMKVPPQGFRHSFDQLLGLVAVNLLTWVGLEWWQRGDADTVLGLDAFIGLSCYLLIALLGAALVARMNSRAADTRALLIPLLSVSAYVLVVLRLAGSHVHSAPLKLVALGAATVYLSLLAMRVLQAAYGRVRLASGLTAVLLILATPVVLDAMDLDTRLWIASDTSDEADADEDAAEPLLYEQPERLVAAVNRVATQRREGGSVYFVGFAGDGDQGIFRREALVAEQAVTSHFGAQGSSLDLINDASERDTFPLATVTGLGQALELLGRRINLADDVVALTLTSHGDTEGLQVSNGSLPLLQPLKPQDLRQVLDDAGIKWRVVIVSACYSGVFLNALKSDTSLVITAADATHSSFGCDDSRELTYFGEAFFKEALPGSASLEQAFSRAASLIAARETAQGLPHSNPQMYMGRLMRAKLALVEARGRVHESRDLVVTAGR